ncbi:MAG: hypothetical protein DMD82_03805, partial [Candidatus Rokuibacteriota bacterium]
FGIFYGKGLDLELRPGPAMTFNGKIFANGNIYIAASNSLQIDQSVRAAGNIYRKIKSEAADPNGPATPPQIADAQGTLQALNFDHDFKPGFTERWASPSDWAKAVMDKFGGQVQDSANGVEPLTPPVGPDLFNPNVANPDALAHQMIEIAKPSDSAALKDAKLFNQAGLRIIDRADGSPLEITDQNGNTVNLPKDAVTTTSFYDARDRKTANVIEVDVSKLKQLANSHGPLAIGILYVASKASPSSSTFPPVRLVKGSNLPKDGLTVASQNPVYIAGNYNTDNGTYPNRPPAAVLADAVTILSENWMLQNYDTKGAATFQSRPAADTTVNAAIATGPSSESTLNADNGKANNLVRLLEDWAGKTFAYSGSMVALWHSQQVNGPWKCCGSSSEYYYGPPNRVWGYDTLFDANPPPGTPSGIIMMKGSWSQS